MISELRKDIPDGNGGYVTRQAYLINKIQSLPLNEVFTLNDLLKDIMLEVPSELGKEFAGLVQSGDLKALIIIEENPVMKYKKIDDGIRIEQLFHQINL